MNGKIFHRCLSLGLITAGFATTLWAQETNQPPLRSGRQPQLAFGAAGRFAPIFERTMGILTEVQRTSLRGAMEGQREKVQKLEEKLREARKELFEASLTTKFDEDAVRQKALAAGALEAEMTVMRMRAFSEMRPPLSPEQLEKLKNLQSGARENEGGSARRRLEPPRDENGLPPKKPTSPN